MKTKMEALASGVFGSIIMLSIHLVWCALVFFGLAQTVVDYLFWIHFVKPIYQIDKFDMLVAIYLLITVSCIGFIVGYIFAKVFNFIASKNEVTSSMS